MQSGDEGVIVIACIAGAVALWVALNRPGAPAPDNQQQAQQVEREGYAGILGVCLLAAIAIAAVLAL